MSITHSKHKLLASEDPDTRDAAVIVCAKEDDTGEGIFTQFVESLEHS